MEDVKSENPKTMKEVQESSSWGEWTIIHDDQENNHVSPAPEVLEEKPKDVGEGNDTQGECPSVEEAREVIEEIDPSTIGNSGVLSVTRDEESDGISVITESDRGEGETKGEVSRVVQGFEDSIPRIGPYANFIAACCLAAAIGFGIGCVVGTGNTQLPSANHQVTPKTSFRPVKDPKSDISDDFSVTIDSEPFIPLQNGPKTINKDPTRQRKLRELLEHATDPNDQNLNMKNFEKIPNYKNSLQKIKLSLDTLCSLLDQNQRSNYENICTRNSRIFEVIELENTVKYLVNEFGYNEDVSMKKFIEGIDSKIGNIVISFLDRLSKILDKMRGKLHNRICLMRNTYDHGEEVQEILNQRLILLENCEKKSSVKVPNAEKKKKFDKKEINSISEVESSEIQNTDILEGKNTKNKRNKNDKSEEFRKKKQYSSNKESLRDDSNEKNISKKYKSNHQDSNEQNDSNSSENVKNKRDNYSKSKKKYKKIEESNENSSEESVSSSFEDQKENKKENRNDFKPSKKYGSPKGEPKENFVEKKHGNNYEAVKEDDEHKNENICNWKKCSKTSSDFEEKNNRKGNGKNGHWQFERARERGKYRSDEDNVHDVWYDDRAKARERARLGF